MLANNRLRWMLAILLLLGGIRFLLLPWLQWQDTRRDELAVITKRLDKALGVLDSRPQLLAAEKKLESLNARDFAPFPTYASTDVARLEIQRAVEGVLRARGVQIEMFVWLSEGRHEPSALDYQRGRVVFRGALADIARVQAELETTLRHVIFREVNVSLDGAATGPDDAVGSLVLVMDAHYRLKAASSTTPATPAVAAGAQ